MKRAWAFLVANRARRRFGIYVLAFLAITLAATWASRALAQPGSFFLWGPIRGEMALYVLDYIRETPHPVIYIDSPGGEMDAALIIAGAIQSKGTAKCVVRGVAASGAFAILQACQVRQMRAGAFLVTHEPRRQPGMPLDRTAAAEFLRYLEATAARWNDYCRRKLRLSGEEYEAKVKGKDWKLDAAEALRVGAIDAVLP